MTVRKLRPPKTGGRSYGFWMDRALAAEPDRGPTPLEADATSDITIVGGGYVGLWTAIAIAREAPDLTVTVLEADLCGSGASGRNGGFTFGWWPKIETLIERAGETEGVRLAEAAAATVEEIGAFCASEGIEAEFDQGGWLWTTTSAAQAGAWKGAFAVCDRLGARPFELVTADEMRRRTGSDSHHGGLFEPGAATVDPARLVRGLKRSAEARGVRVHELSPVLRLDLESGRLATRSGATVSSGQVVLATNAWLAGLPDLRRAIVPLSSDVVATEPIPGPLAESGWRGGEAISDSRLMVHYYRKTADGRVVFGKGGGGLGWLGRVPDGFDRDRGRVESAAAYLRRLVPAASEAALAAGWGGAVDRSFDGLPFFGRLTGDAGVVYGAGFSGNGVAPSLLASRILGSMAIGRDDEWSGCALARGAPGEFPPEPFRGVGSRLVRSAVSRTEAKQDRGQEAGRLTRYLASLAPSGFFKAGGEDESPPE